MKANKKLIQIILTLVGVILIVGTYFFIPEARKSRLVGSIVEDKLVDSIVKNPEVGINKKDNSFENVEYKGFYNLDRPFLILSEQANIFSDDPDIVHMINMKVTFKVKDDRTVIITGSKGIYNKVTYDCFFEGDVKASDGEIVFYSDNLDLLAAEDIISIYNNVSLISENGSIKADKIDYDFESKNYKISMFNDQKVKIKLTK